MNDKREICWMDDCTGLMLTCHTNSKGSRKETYLGEVSLKEDKWYSKVDGIEKGPHKTLHLAKRFVEAILSGSEVLY